MRKMVFIQLITEFRKLIIAIFILGGSINMLSAQCTDPGLQITSIVNSQDADCNDGEVTITTTDLSVASSVKAEYTITKGDYARTETAILDKSLTQFTFSGLPVGTFTVKILYFCGSNTISPSYTSAESTVEINGSYNVMDIKAGVRHTLPEKNTGIADITITGGSPTYTVELQKDESGSWTTIASWSDVAASQKISSFDLAEGQYRIRAIDGCATRVEIFSIQTIDIAKFVSNTTLLNKFVYRVDAANNYDDLECGVLRFDLEQGLFAGTFNPYMQKDSLIKYFDIKWYYKDEGNLRKDTVYMAGARDSSPEAYTLNWGEIHLTDNGDRNYYQDYSVFKNKYIIIDFKVRGTSTVISHELSCAGEQRNVFGITTSSGTLPVDCPTFGVKIPKEDIKGNRAARICFPISYTLKYFENVSAPVTGTGLDSPTSTDTKNNLLATDFLEGGAVYHLGSGYYRFEFSDANGNNWTDSIMVDGMLGSIKSNPISGTPMAYGRYINSSSLLPYLDCVSDNFKSDTCFVLNRRFIADINIPANTTVTYTKVPDGFYFPQGSSYKLDRALTSFDPNRDYSVSSSAAITSQYAIFPAGDYEIDLTACDGDHRKMTFTITYSELENLSYDLLARCGGADFKVTGGNLKLYPSSIYTKFYYRILSYNGIYSVSEMQAQGINTAGSWFMYDQATSTSEVLGLPKQGSYEIAFSTGTSNLYYFVRSIEVTEAPTPVLTTSSKAFVCPDNLTSATIFAIPEKQGALPFTYNLYAEDGTTLLESKPNVDNYSPVVFTGINLGQGDKCVLQIEHCGGNTSQQMTVQVSSLKDIIRFNETGAICGDEFLELRVDTLPAPGFAYEWYFFDNTTEYKLKDSYIYHSTGTYTQLLDSIYGVGNTKPSQADSHVRLKVIGNICDNDIELTRQLQVSMPKITWNPDLTLADENERRNWNNPDNWIPKGYYPSACSDVYIPGGLAYYPQLTEDTDDTGNQIVYVCKNIYFMHGGEITRPDLLSYEKANVQFNFGLENPSDLQTKENQGVNPGNVGVTDGTWQHQTYSAAHTNSKLSRNHWHMLSAPLKQMTSGGFAFGGYPLTFMRKWDMLSPSAGSVMEGRWTKTYSSFVEELGHGEGYILWINKFQNGVNMYEESVERSDAFITTETRKAGLKELNGIVQFPYHEDDDMIRAHRTHKVTGSEMSYYYILEDKKNDLYMDVLHVYDAYTFKNDAYRFITEDENNIFQTTTTVSYNNNGDNKTLLVGNPYMSTIDFHEFYKLNKDKIAPDFKLWRGTGVNTGVYEQYNYDADQDTGIGLEDGVRYIAPMQSFIVTTLAAQGEQQLTFDVTKLSVAPPITGNELRSLKKQGVRNLIRVKATNNANQSDELAIMHGDNYSDNFDIREDAYKMFGQVSSIPYIYTVADDWYVSINKLKNTDIIVPIGIKTQTPGNITFTITGMNNHNKAGKIIFIDTENPEEFDITGTTDFVYSFNNYQQGIQQGRFFIRFESGPVTGIDTTHKLNIKAYIHNNGICVSSLNSDIIHGISVYDTNGRLLYDNQSVNNFIFTINNENLQLLNVLLIKAVTDKGVSNIKLLK